MPRPQPLTSITIPSSGDSCIVVWTGSADWLPVTLQSDALVLSNGRTSTSNDGGVISGMTLTVTFMLNGPVKANEVVTTSGLPLNWATDTVQSTVAFSGAPVINNSTRGNGAAFLLLLGVG